MVVDSLVGAFGVLRVQPLLGGGGCFQVVLPPATPWFEEESGPRMLSCGSRMNPAGG